MDCRKTQRSVRHAGCAGPQVGPVLTGRAGPNLFANVRANEFAPTNKIEVKNMRQVPSIKSVMTPFPYSIDIEAPINEARAFMQKQNIRHLPVIAGGKLAGIVSDRDIKLFLGPH